jgi:hypothetical protein
MTQPPLPIEYNGSFRDLYRDWEDSLRREATLQAQLERVREALEIIWREWAIRCDPNGDFPDWPDDAMAVMNDAWKNGFAEKARQALNTGGV